MTLKGKFVQTGDTVNGDKNSFCRVWSASHGSGRKWDKAFVIAAIRGLKVKTPLGQI